MASPFILYITSWRLFSIILATVVKFLPPLPLPSKKEAKPHHQTQEVLAPTPQNPEEVVVIIDDGGDGLPVVKTLVLDNGVEKPQHLHDASVYRYFGSFDNNAVGDARLSKCIRRSAVSMGQLQHLLKGREPHETSKPEPEPTVTLGDGGFVSSLQMPDGTDVSEVFTKVQLRYAHGFASTQYFHSRCSAVKPSMLKQPRAGFKHIHISTGVCLFSEAVLGMTPGQAQASLLDGDNPTIPSLLPPHVDLTIYELETIFRVSSAIADVVGLIKQSHPADRVTIHVDIPDFQYHWTACELLKRHLVDVDYVRGWIGAIDGRKRLLGAIMTSTIHKMLRDRCLPIVQVIITSGTESAVRLVNEKLGNSGTVPTLEEIIDVLRTEGEDSGQWREFFHHLEMRRQPSTVEDLGRLMYVFKMVKPALYPDGKIIDRPGQRLLINVDDIAEWRILDGAKAFLKRYYKQHYHVDQEPVPVGLFPVQRVFTTAPGRLRLYHNDPGQHMYHEEDRAVVGPLDIIAMTYGQQMRDWLEKTITEIA